MDKLRIGLIGVMHRAEIARYWQKDERAEIVAGCDILATGLQAFRQRYGTDRYVTDDYHSLLARSDIDVVGIFTPDNLHEEHAVAALLAGKDVFLEKPMSISIEGCQNIRAAEKTSGKKLMIGMNLRYADLFHGLKKIIDQGLLGKVEAVWVRHFVGSGGYYYFHDYRANRAGSLSLLLQKGSHDIDMIHYLTGERVERVTGLGGLDYYGGNKPDDLHCESCPEKGTCPDFSNRPNKTQCAFRAEVDVEDHNMLLMQLSNGIRASYMQCHYVPDTWRNYTVIGTLGRAEILADENTIRVYTQKQNPHRHFQNVQFSQMDYTIGVDSEGHGGADPKICKAFLDYCLEDVAPRATSLDGLYAVAVGVWGSESIRHGSVPYEVDC